MSDASSLMVVVDGASYAVTEIPAPDAPIVVQARDEILGGLRLDEMLPELYRSRALIDLARSGVGVDLVLNLNKPLSDIQIGLATACRTANRVIFELSTTVSELLGALHLSFSHLFAGRETITTGMLSKCSSFALKMAGQAGAVADDFEALGDQTLSVLGEVRDRQSVRADVREKLKKEQAELEVRSKETKKLIDELAAAKAELEEQYKEAKEAAEKHEGRAFGLAIVGAIFTPLAQGIGAFAGAYTGGPARAPGATKPKPSRPPELPPKPAAAGGSKRDPKAGGIAPKLGGDKKADQLKDAKPTAADDAKSSADPKVPTDTSATPSPIAGTGAGAGVRGAADGAQGVGDGASEASGTYERIAENYHKQKMFFLEKLQEAKKAEREAMAAVVGYAERMKNLKDEAEVNQCVLESLHQAVGALQRVVVVLRQAEDFWRRMASSFERLAKHELKSQIELYRQEISDAQERIALYLEDDFKRQLLGYLASWQALKLVARDYSAACLSIAEGVEEDYVKNLTEAQHRAAIPKLAEAVLAGAGPQLKLLEAEERELKAEVLALPKAA